MKKIISILACVCLLLSVVIVPVFAAETTATITFDDPAKATWSAEQQAWTENGITVTNNKAASTTNIDVSKQYSNPARFYKSSDLTVAYPGMTQIVFDSDGTSKYITALKDSIKEGTVTVASDKVTVVFDAPVDSYTINLTGGQVRLDALTVTAIVGEDACTHSETTATSNGNETHSITCNDCDETVSAAAACVDSDVNGVCDICGGTVAVPFDPTGKTPAEIVDAAYELEAGESFEKNVTLTGVITAVNTAYSEQYGNITVTIAVEGKEDKPIQCYRLAGEGAEDITVEDTITVTGILTSYKGTIQFAQGCTLDAVVKGELEIVIPEDPREIVDAAFALETGTSLLYEATLEGKIVEISDAYTEEYKNMTLTIEVEGTTGVHNLVCYRLKPAEGEDAAALKVNDVIAVTGTIKNYNGTVEFDSGCTFVLVEAYVEETFEGTDPEAPIELAVNESVPATLKEIKVPAAGTVFVKVADANGIFHVTSTTGACLLINGRTNQVEISDAYDLTLCGYEMVNIYNSGEETITLYVFLEAGAGEVFGTMENPEVLEFMENPYMPSFPPCAEALTELEAGNQGYFYKVIAPKDCIFVINVSASDDEWNTVGYQYNVTNNATSWQSDFIVKAPDADDYYDSLFVPVNAGDEIIINAGTFNPEDRWNAPAGTLSVSINTTTVGSSDYPAVLTETGTYSATVEAGSQGYYYEYTAEADGVVTVTMNDASWTYVVNNLTSYEYGDTQWSDSDPVVASTSVDVKEGDLISIMVATYDPADQWNAPAGTVNWTLSWSEKVADPIVPGVVTIDDVDAVAGEEFTVTIDISENPGIIGATFAVNYDADVLELVSATAGNFANESEEKDGAVLANYNFGPTENSPFIITWVDALAEENVDTNGVFVTLTFKVKANAAEGSTEISVTAEEIFDKDFNDVEFTVDSAIVNITAPEVTRVPGDVNEDGVIDGIDIILLVRHFNGWTVDINLDNADVNADGNVDGIDIILLVRYFNGWDVTLK